MNQYFGWEKDSIMRARYQHLAGGESNKYLGEKLRLVESQSKQSKLPKLVECPIATCRESNNPDAPFCVKCRYPLTVTGHVERRNQEEHTQKQREQDMESLKEQVAALVRAQKQNYKDELTIDKQNFKDDYNWEKGWVRDPNTSTRFEPEPILIHDGKTGRINRLGIDVLLDQSEEKMTKEDRKFYEDLKNYKGVDAH